MAKTNYQTIDEDIAAFPKDIQKILKEIRATIKTAAPEAEEKISYQMPTFYLNGNLIHFAAYKNHIGIYPTPSGTEAFNLILSVTKGQGSMMVTSEEYSTLWSGKNVKAVVYPMGFDNDIPSEALKRLLDFLEKNENVRYMLISDVSRFGTLYPMGLFQQAREILRSQGRPLDLIVDGAQSFGRRETDLGQIQPDAYLASASALSIAALNAG